MLIGMIPTGDYLLRLCAPSDMPPAEIDLPSLTDQDFFLLEYIEEISHLNTNDELRSERFSYRDLPVR